MDDKGVVLLGRSLSFSLDDEWVGMVRRIKKYLIAVI